MAARVGENAVIPVLNVTARFNQEPVKFSTFVNALRAHYQGDIPSYEDVAIQTLQEQGSYSCDLRERDLNLTPEQQTVIEKRVIVLLSIQALVTSHRLQIDPRTRKDKDFCKKVVTTAALIFVFAVCVKLCYDELQVNPNFYW